MIKRIQSSPFIRSVLVIMTGTVIAQVIAYLTYPILTRIFTPAEMGDLGYYNRLIGFIAAIATARYELSLPIAKQDFHAYGLYRLSIRIALVVLGTTFISGLIYILIFHPPSFTFNYLLAVIIGTASLVWTNLGTNWAIRKKLFRQISQQRIANGLGSNGLRLVAGWLGWGSLGLIWGTVAGFVLASIPFIRPFKNAHTTFSAKISRRREYHLARLNKQYPFINLPHVLVDIGVDLFVATLIIRFFSKEEFGFYSHAYAMLRVPLNVVGQSISQVFFNQCSSLLNEKKPISGLVKKTMGTLFLIAVVPFGTLFFYGEEIFSFVFGNEWAESGLYASYLSPFLLLNFMLSPISVLPLIIGRQREFFLVGILVGLLQLVLFGLLPYLYDFTLLRIILFQSLSHSLILILTGYFYVKFSTIASNKFE